MKSISTLLAVLLLSGIVGVSCAPQNPYSPEEWQLKMDQFFDDVVKAQD